MTKTQSIRVKVSMCIGPLLAVVGMFSVSPAQAADQASCPSSAATADGVVTQAQVDGADAVQCELVGLDVAAGDGLTVSIPPPGEGLEMDALGLNGDVAALTVLVKPDGDIAFSSDPVSVDRGALSACDDTAHASLGGGSLDSGETFNIKTGSFPNYLPESTTRDSIEAGIRAWPMLNNDCGMADDISTTVNDGGGTSAPSAVTPTGCDGAGNDSTSVFSFGSLQQGLLGLTCRHILTTPYGHYSDGGDVKFEYNLAQYGYSWTNFGGASTCNNQVDMQSVATHESGHWWGAAHVDASSHPFLTMRSGGIDAVTCNTMLRTLGRGDVLEMRSLEN